jgi:nicotinate-nucleotide adenylyltransferase
LGIFGGTFDPVHYGHLVLAEQCREQCNLDAVWFLPSGSPPHKQDANITDAKRRVEMLELAISGHSSFSVSDIELRRTGPTFTVETLQQIHDDPEGPNRELFFLMGADSLSELVTWREPSRIVELATLVAVNRGGDPLPNRELLIEQLGEATVSRIIPVSIPGQEVASSDLRKRVRTEHSIRYLTPRSVEVYIQQQNLYRDHAE